jgi:hypothetical protein
MGPILESLSATAVLVGAAYGLLALGVRNLGSGPGISSAMRFLVPALINFALLALGLRFLAAQDWFRPAAAAVGVAVPIVMLTVLLKGKDGNVAR